MNPYFKAFPQQNFQTQMVSISEFLENNSKKELELSQNSSGEQTEELLLNLFYKFSKTFSSKPGKDTTTIENYRLISLLNKNTPPQNISK